MSKPRARPRKSTKKRGAFKLTPKRIKSREDLEAVRASNRRILDQMYGPRHEDYPTEEEFNRA